MGIYIEISEAERRLKCKGCTNSIIKDQVKIGLWGRRDSSQFHVDCLHRIINEKIRIFKKFKKVEIKRPSLIVED